MSKAHDSGLCAVGRRRFASDLRDLALAELGLNRHVKCARGTREWLPTANRCWCAATVVQFKRAYGLRLDWREAEVLERVLSGCPQPISIAKGVCP